MLVLTTRRAPALAGRPARRGGAILPQLAGHSKSQLTGPAPRSEEVQAGGPVRYRSTAPAAGWRHRAGRQTDGLARTARGAAAVLRPSGRWQLPAPADRPAVPARTAPRPGSAPRSP